MLREIILKNFRSIEKSKILFDSNVKVLIGENGTGKTNVLLALKFISNCVSQSPMRAIQAAGGLDQVFRIVERRASECTFSVKMLMPEREKSHRLDNFYIPSEHDYEVEGYFVNYEFSLKYVANEQQLYVSGEILSYGETEECDQIIFDRSLPNLSTEKFEVRKFEFSSFDIDSLFIHSASAGRVLQKKKSELNEEQKDTEFEVSLVNKFLIEVVNIAGFNFTPHVLRETSDILSSEVLGYNGENFPTLLNNLFEPRDKRNHFWRKFRGRFSIRPIDIKRVSTDIKDSYSEILPFLKEVKTSEGIDTTNIAIRFKEEHLAKKFYGVNHLSDGSLKFLALSTSIALSNYTFIYFEEIENYLNPRALSFLFELMRDYANEMNVQFLITTHSETVLNLCEPNEVIISKRKENGSTTYIRPKNLKTLQGELDSGGFGLGTYWSKGGIEV